MSTFIQASMSGLFSPKRTMAATASVQRQVSIQQSRHDVSGTLIVCITCKHRNAQVFAPFIIDPDKAVRAWNRVFPGDMIKTNDAQKIAEIMEEAETRAEKAYYLLSGATFGSSFIGMVHILNSSRTVSSQSMTQVASSLQASMQAGRWLASASGAFGVDASFANSARNMLSSQNIQSHCSLVTMGVIPSIKSNEMSKTVQKFATSPDEMMQKMIEAQNADSESRSTIASDAATAQKGSQIIQARGATLNSIISGMAAVDDTNNKVIDITSLMDAMDDYVSRCNGGAEGIGVPINYYLKPITRSMVARSWLGKYYPELRTNRAGSADDSEPVQAPEEA
jgi:hypothetical protein